MIFLIKWSWYGALSFKDLMYSISLHFGKVEVIAFATCIWFIWFVRNKLRHESTSVNANSLALRIIYFSEEFLRANQCCPSNPIRSLLWIPKERGCHYITRFLKLIQLVFSNDKIDIGILVCNYLSIPLLAKTTPCMCRFNISYGELLAIIEGYVSGSPLGECMITESDSLLAINSLKLCGVKIFWTSCFIF